MCSKYYAGGLVTRTDSTELMVASVWFYTRAILRPGRMGDDEKEECVAVHRGFLSDLQLSVSKKF